MYTCMYAIWSLLRVMHFSAFHFVITKPNTCKGIFNPNVATFQLNFAEGLHFSAFHFVIINQILFSIKYINQCAVIGDPMHIIFFYGTIVFCRSRLEI